MGVDKDVPKNGGYVGGFFHLFDWKAKSRKKLFSSKSDIPEHAKQGKRSDGNLPTTQVYLMDEDEDEAGLWSNARGNSDYSCASSVTDEEGCGSKGPSVVARLMGLDSMPGTFSSEPYSTPFFDTQSLRDAQFHQRRNLEYSQNYHQGMYSGDLIHNRIEGPVRSGMESKPPPPPQRILSRPIEKFQSEILPHKSAKTIPVTQHKLLSPIKCPGFVHSRNAADIMKAAAKIIEPAPMKSKLPSQGSSFGRLKVGGDFRAKEEIPQKVVSTSSVALRLRDLREKVETTQRTSQIAEPSKRISESDSAAVRYLRGQSLSKSYNGAGTSSSFRASSLNKEEGSSGFRSNSNGSKSVSLAIQAKANVQKREGLTSSDKNGSCQQEQNESKLRQSRHHKNNHKKSPAPNTFGAALRQNNQKQNCSVDKEKLPSRKPLLDSSVRAKSSTSGKSSGSITKAGSRKLEVLDGDKEISQSNMRNFPRKKRSIGGGFQFEKNKGADDLLSDNKHKKQAQSVVQKNWIEDDRKNGMDVVSFTFTAPLSQKNHQGQQSFDQWGKGVLSETDSMKLSSLGYNVIGGDALSKLLEQKLEELTYEVSSSCNNNASASVDSNSTAPSAFHESGMTPETVSSKPPRLQAKRGHDLLVENKFGADSHVDLFSRNPPLHRLRRECQGADDMEVDAKNLFDSHNPSPVSVLEPSFVSESWMSSESTESNWIEGKFTTQSAAEALGLSFSRKPHPTETDMDLSDSASSLSKHSTTNTSSGFMKSTNWESEYVKEIASDVEVMYKDFTLGRASNMIPHHLFQQLEDRNGFMETDDGGESRLRRKLLFDCVSESMEKRFRRFVGSGSKAWETGLAMVRRKEGLGEEVYREIKGWRGMSDCMVDDLVDKDMGSSKYGKWQDFEAEGFEIGVGIEDEILSSLVDEAIAGILRL